MGNSTLPRKIKLLYSGLFSDALDPDPSPGLIIELGLSLDLLSMLD